MTDHSQVPYSGAWFRKKNDGELQAMIDGNMPGGVAHDGAVAELDRRSAASERKRQMFWIRATFAVSVLGIVVATFT